MSRGELGAGLADGNNAGQGVAGRGLTVLAGEGDSRAWSFQWQRILVNVPRSGT